MLFRRKEVPDIKLSQYAFITAEPYVVNYEEARMSGLINILDRCTDYDREDELEFKARLLKFAIDQRFVSEGDPFCLSIDKDSASMSWTMSYFNFRSLVDEPQMLIFQGTMNRNEGEFVGLLESFSCELGMLYPRDFLNTICNRVMTSITSLSTENEDKVKWMEIHTTFPYLWILLMMQAIIRGEAAPLPLPR